MFTVVTFLTVFLIINCGSATFHTCVPNTQFMWNGRICYCNNMGRWTETSCQVIGRQKSCQPGQIIWEECSQCICQDNGKLICTNTQCSEHSANNTAVRKPEVEEWCTPFRSYYINCSLCVCLASGRMFEARCASDLSCTLKPNLSLDVILNSVCIPKVTYVFTCRSCLCSEQGFFSKDKCVSTCPTSSPTTRRCIPRTFYKVQCNVCRCPDSGVPDSRLCTKLNCQQQLKLESLTFLRNRTNRCIPNKFTKPKCFYCECTSQGRLDKNACMELECLKINNFKYETSKNTCSPGELVAFCTECFCAHSGYSFGNLCTRVCLMQNKLQILEKVLIENAYLISPMLLKHSDVNKSCDPNSVYLFQGRYCLCPENGYTDSKTCTSVIDEINAKKKSHASIEKLNVIDYEAPCEPHTFIEFDCNTCYCGKNGRIDPKWCTFDDCEAKRLILGIQKSKHLSVETDATATCIPGSISKSICNFCICGDNGLVKDRACTKNVCTGHDKEATGNEIVCEPSTYYTVDCNICYCPTDGVKNLEKCSKNHCEINFLRSESCVPGELFSDDCNICICPLNGEKKDKACTNRQCSEKDTTWKKIFKLSQSLLGDHVTENTKRKLNLCFPGDEFEDGCQVCACPDLGLREYATCTPVCEDNQTTKPPELSDLEDKRGVGRSENHPRTRRESEVESCITYNLTDSSERKDCTPGTMYIIRCRQCICPLMGNINYFCRPLPQDFYCEQAYPNFNYLPMGRRTAQGNHTPNNSLAPNIPKSHIQLKISHNHTKYRCQTSGARVSDDCHICDCEEDSVIILEHCFKSEEEKCQDIHATFLSEENRIKD